MKTYWKIIFGVFFITFMAGLPAHAEDPAPAHADNTMHVIDPSAVPVDDEETPHADDAAAHANDNNGGLVQEPPEIAAQEEAAQAHTAPVAKKPTNYYSYAHDESEYSVSLPEAPTVRTLWNETTETTPFLKYPPTDHAALGEIATFKRVDIDTEESYEVKITFLRAKQTYLESLNAEKIQHMLLKHYGDLALSKETFTISGGTGTLKWATLSGFTLDSHHHPAFSAMHYLTGLQSVLVIQVTYSIENKQFQEYYDHMVKSITYVAP